MFALTFRFEHRNLLDNKILYGFADFSLYSLEIMGSIRQI